MSGEKGKIVVRVNNPSLGGGNDCRIGYPPAFEIRGGLGLENGSSLRVDALVKD